MTGLLCHGGIGSKRCHRRTEAQPCATVECRLCAVAQPFRAVAACGRRRVRRRDAQTPATKTAAGARRHAYRLHARFHRPCACVIDHLGRQSGLYDTYIRTDSQWITKQPVPLPARNARNLNDFDAVFLFISGEGGWTAQQKKDFVAFVKDDGKGVVGAHTGNAAFYEWPEFGELMGGYFDNHPWGVFEGRVVVDAPGLSGDAALRVRRLPDPKSSTCCATSRIRASASACSRISTRRTSI